MKTFRFPRTKALILSVVLGTLLGAPTVHAAPLAVSNGNTIDVSTLKPSDWASWPEVSIPTVAEVQSSCFDVERQCRRSGTAAPLCAKEKRACLSPATL